MSKIPAWIWAVVILVPIVTLVLYRGKLSEGAGLKPLAIKKTEGIKVDKKNPNWLEDYCLAEVKNLPAAPFAYTKQEIQPRSWSRPSDLYLKKYIPTDKWSKAQTCAIWYRFEDKPAYASVGVEYVFDIKAMNVFAQNTDTLYSKAIDKSWKKISPISDKDDGRPPYSYDGMPLVFTRENKSIGTIEYATVHFGSKYLYVHFTVYE